MFIDGLSFLTYQISITKYLCSKALRTRRFYVLRNHIPWFRSQVYFGFTIKENCVEISRFKMEVIQFLDRIFKKLKISFMFINGPSFLTNQISVTKYLCSKALINLFHDYHILFLMLFRGFCLFCNEIVCYESYTPRNSN